MGHRIRFLAMVAAGLLAVSGCSSSDESDAESTSAPPTPAAYSAELAPLIEKAMQDNAIPGAIVMISSPTKGDWAATFGTRRIGADEPLTVDDYFRIGSNTKTMTSTVILQLVQEGKLSLDDKIAKFRPDVPGGDNITIAQLAEMRSGLFSYTFDLGFNETLDRDPGKAWTPDELLAIAFSHPPNSGPGEKFDYCNTNIVLLGLVIEQITGKSAAEAFQERIFEPLGLTHSSLPAADDTSIPDPHPQGYAFGTNVSTIESYELPEPQQAEALAGTLLPGNQTGANPSWAWTAGGATSTVGDLATYVKALVGGGLLDEATQKLRLDSIQPTNPDNPELAGYGLGIARFGPHLIGHDGQIPGYMSFMGYDPESELTIIIGTNLAAVPSGEGSALVLLKAILPTFYGADAVPTEQPSPSPTR